MVEQERVLVTTLTKRMAEDLDGFPLGKRHQAYVTCTPISIPSSALKSSVICALGEFDVLVGINLLREGLDIPEVSLVAILDADKEGFLRSERSLIQTIGRAARHIHGTAILYADKDYTIHAARDCRNESPPREADQHTIWKPTGSRSAWGVTKRIKDIIDGVYDPAKPPRAN